MHVLCQTNIEGDMERKGMINFSFIDCRSQDRTCETKHTGSNLIHMKNALLSLMSSIQGTHSGYTLFEKIEIRSEFHIMLLPCSKKIKK